MESVEIKFKLKMAKLDEDISLLCNFIKTELCEQKTAKSNDSIKNQSLLISNSSN